MKKNKQITFLDKIAIPYIKLKNIGLISIFLIILGIGLNIINYTIINDIVLNILSLLVILLVSMIFIYTYFVGPNNIAKLIQRNENEINNVQTSLIKFISVTLELQKNNLNDLQSINKILKYLYPLIKPMVAESTTEGIEKLDIILSEYVSFTNRKSFNLNKIEKAVSESDFIVLQIYFNELLDLFNTIEKQISNKYSEQNAIKENE
jgi:hypothetical protein